MNIVLQTSQLINKMKNVPNSIVERINREVGSDIKNLRKCKNIVDEYTKRVGDIEVEVNPYI